MLILIVSEYDPMILVMSFDDDETLYILHNTPKCRFQSVSKFVYSTLWKRIPIRLHFNRLFFLLLHKTVKNDVFLRYMYIDVDILR